MFAISCALWLCASVTLSYATSDFVCDGPDLNTLVDVLRSLINWKQLAAQISLRAGTIESVAENCVIARDRNYCNRRRVILHYCDSLNSVGEIQHVPCHIADALDVLGKDYFADALRTKFSSAKCIKKDVTGVPKPRSPKDFERIDTCIELGESFDIDRATLESYRQSDMTPEDMCLEFVDIWLHQATCTEDGCGLEDLSLAGVLFLQRKRTAEELKAAIKQRFAEIRREEEKRDHYHAEL